MTRSLATAGGEHGIKANLIAPAAMTRMAGQGAGEAEPPDAGPMASHLVAPMVAYLAHEDCPVTGEIYAAGAGRFARRSEEHTSELQSLMRISYAVFCLKKKKKHRK